MNGVAIAMLILSGVGLLIAIFLAVMVSIRIISDMVRTKRYYDDLEERLRKINNASDWDDFHD